MKKKGKKNTRNHIHYKSEDVGRIMRKGRYNKKKYVIKSKKIICRNIKLQIYK